MAKGFHTIATGSSRGIRGIIDTYIRKIGRRSILNRNNFVIFANND